MSLTHFEPRQDEGNTLNPGSTPAPLRRFQDSIYIYYELTLCKKEYKSSVRKTKRKELKLFGKED